MRRVTVKDPDVFVSTSKWVEAFVLIKGEAVLLYKFQKKFYKFFDETKSSMYIVKARQLGFSWSIAIGMLKKALTEKNTTCIITSRTHPQAIEVMRHCILAYNDLPDEIILEGAKPGTPPIRKLRLLGRSHDQPAKTEMYFENGSRLISLPNNPDAVRGYNADIGFWDEAAKFKQEAEMHAAMVPTTTRGGRVFYNSSQQGTQSLFYKDAEMAKKGELENHLYMEVPWTAMLEEDQNREDVKAYLRSVAFFKKKYGENSFFFQEEFCGVAVDESVAIFTHAILDKCCDLWVEKKCEYRNPTGKYPVYIGIDIGRYVDSTVAIAVEDMGDYKQVIEILELKSPMTFPDQEKKLEAFIRRHNPAGVAIDHTAIGMNTAEKFQAMFGNRVELIDFNLPSKEKLVLDAYTVLQQGIVAMPPKEGGDGETLYHQMHNVRRDRTAGGNIKYAQAETDMHDDFQWAFCLTLRYFANINVTGGVILIGKKETSMVSATPTEGVEIKILRQEPALKTLQLGVGANRDQITEQMKKDGLERKTWAMRDSLWHAAEKVECPDCKAIGTVDIGKDWKGKEIKVPVQMFRVGKPDATAAEYICERCHNQPPHTGKFQCTIGCFRNRVIVRKK